MIVTKRVTRLTFCVWLDFLFMQNLAYKVFTIILCQIFHSDREYVNGLVVHKNVRY